MNTSTTTPAEVLHLTAGHVAKLAAAYGDTDKALAGRAVVLADALAYGVDVKTIAADMAAEHRRNANIPEVSEQTLGRARFAITVAEMIGTDIRAWAKRDVAAVASCVKVAKRVGVKRASAAIREALAPTDKSQHAAREELAVGVVASLLAEVLPEPAPKPKRSATEADGDTESDGDTATAPKLAGAAEALAAIRTAVRFLTSPEGEVSADMASALAELATAATAARKRARVELATAKREAATA